MPFSQRLFAGQAYCNEPITRGLSDRVVLSGAMRADAVFADILRAARRMLSDVDISDPARLFNNLQKPASDPTHRDDPPLPNAA